MPPLEAPRKTGVPFDYEGIPIHARGLTLAAVYDSHWQPTAGSAWVEYGYVPDCWRHPAFPGHILWTPEDGVVLIAHLSSSTPRIATVEALGQLALGPTATPISVATYPLALRLPMRGPGQLDVPAGGFRCRRLWPLKGEPAHVETVERVPIELRISGTRGNTGVRIYAEAFVGRAHVTAAQDEKDGRKRKKEKPRSLILAVMLATYCCSETHGG
jgi:hypothetical protein